MFQNIPLSVAVQPLLHVLLHCMMPPTVALRKGSCWKRNGLKSQMCIPHGFDFSVKVPQLSFVGIFLMWQLLIRENLRLRLWRCWFSQDPQEAVRGSVWFGCLSIVPIVPMVPCVCLCSLGAEQQMSRLAGVGQEMYPGAPAAPGVPGRHVCSGQPSGQHWEHVTVSVAHGGVRQNGTPAKLESFSDRAWALQTPPEGITSPGHHQPRALATPALVTCSNQAGTTGNPSQWVPFATQMCCQTQRTGRKKVA